MKVAKSSTRALGTEHLVSLDQDHPGFRDQRYRERRDAIARLAMAYRPEEPVADVEYTPEEHAVWRTMWREINPLHERYACEAYRRGLKKLHLSTERIPQLSEVNTVLARLSTFQLVPVAGLVLPEVFLAHLEKGHFLSTQYVRHHSVPLYTPEPDVIHELVGHAATLIDPVLAGLNRRFGEALVRGGDVLRLSQAYWYTLEFGLVREHGELRAYGAGLLSSFGELSRFETQAKIEPLDLDRAVQLPYDPTMYQHTLFEADSFESMVDYVTCWLDRQ